MSLLKFCLSNANLLQHYHDQERHMVMRSCLMHAFDIFILFVCSHGSVVKHAGAQCLFTFQSFPMVDCYTADYQSGIHTQTFLYTCWCKHTYANSVLSTPRQNVAIVTLLSLWWCTCFAVLNKGVHWNKFVLLSNLNILKQYLKTPSLCPCDLNCHKAKILRVSNMISKVLTSSWDD